VIPNHIREEAYQVWRAEGTDEATAERLRAKYPRLKHLNRKTIGRWREEGEWESRRVGESASSRVGESASRRVGESASGRVGESASGRVGESASRRVGESAGDGGDREGRLWKIIDDGITVLQKAPLADAAEVTQVIPTAYKLLQQILNLRLQSRKMTDEQKLESARRYRAALDRVPQLARELRDPMVAGALAREVELEFGSL